jgi:hypothetical protein
MIKVILGLAIGLLLNYGAMVGHHGFDPKSKLRALWIILTLCSWPFMGWGAYHFAIFRGYAGSVGASLAFLAAVMFSVMYGILFHRHFMPLAVHIILAAFVAAFPIAVLLAMPDKGRRSRSRHRSSSGTGDGRVLGK